MTISETKNIARKTLKGKLSNAYIITGLYTVISLTLEFITNKLYNHQSVFNTSLIICMGVLRILFGYGLTSSLIKISKQQEPIAYSNFINDAVLNCGKILKMLLALFIKILIPIIILSITLAGESYMYILFAANSTKYKLGLILTFILFLGSFIYLISYSLNYVFAIFCLIDNNDLSPEDNLKKSKYLIKGNKLKYLGLMISFIGYYLIIFFLISICTNFLGESWMPIILVVLTSLLTPYITISQYIFYEELINDKDVNSAKNVTSSRWH